MQPEGESNLDRMAQWVSGLFKFKNFYDMVDSTLKQRLAITKVITSSPTLQSAPASLKIGCDGIVGLRTIVIFYDNERCDLPSHHITLCTRLLT